MNARELVEHIPATYRQVDYWRRKGWLGRDCQNPGSGAGRGDLTPVCLRRATLIAALCAAGVSTTAAVNVVSKMDDEYLMEIGASDDEGIRRIAVSNGVSFEWHIPHIPGWREVIG